MDAIKVLHCADLYFDDEQVRLRTPLNVVTG